MKNGNAILWTTMLLVGLLAGCTGGYDEAEPVPADARQAQSDAVPSAALDPELPEVVRTAVTVAREIEADPDNTEAILADHGLTAESFEEMLYDISSDPELSRAYNAALN